MTGFIAIYKRELFSYLVTPLAWVLLVVFLLLQGLHFHLLVQHFSSHAELTDQTPLQAFFGNTVFFYLVLFLFAPALTMRLFAEERRSGTLEPLLTAPVSSTSVVLGKYAATLTTYAAMWVPTLLYVVIVARTGPVDAGVVASSYFGAILVGAGYLALGLLMSALTSSQLVALLSTSAIVLALFMLGIFGEYIAREGTLLYDVSVHVSVWAQMNDFASGILDTRRLVFCGTLIVLPLFAAVRALEASRWP
jgi:ABC-2 type transport system permease protein